MERAPKEESFYDPNESKYIAFPFGLSERPQVDLSVIIPAYNESVRLPIMIGDALDYLSTRESRGNFTYEVIIIDDGSTDGTSQVALKYSQKFTTDVFRVLTLHKNRGKGAAVRIGMLSARGRILLFADADGATKFSDVEKLEKKLSSLTASRWNGSNAVICGSRAHLESDVLAKRHPFRNLLMYCFHFAVWILCVKGIRDTQCGFKLFSRSAARVIFHNQHVERWAFDVDVLYLANYFGISIAEVPVSWHEVDGSKLVPVLSWLQMAKDLLSIRLRYALGAWKIEPGHRID
ncbi:unnamed protein product [Protopolystoma xenopodis]|uniref:Dolichyl-phosphate beta-glucosyltransferase n=1 Tax=Protopolystoma xenopodis TaxID=117903 RepID=A0A3S5A5W2_9PLAT|nr:unnamed protein product [Protopolystoma xenopodis]